MKVLECSSKGDKRFSALHAKVTLDGVTQSIENWYQLSKDFNGKRPKSFKQAKRIQHKGYNPSSFWFRGVEFDVKYLTSFYNLLWVEYLDNNQDLVEYANKFDDFTDYFKTINTINCQADVIKKYIKEGKAIIIKESEEFVNKLNSTDYKYKQQ